MRISHRVDGRARAPGFTLIELLVVVAIVAVLMALMMPVVSKVRVAGQKAGCLKNMRTYHQAVIAYTNDNDGMILPWVDYVDSEEANEKQLKIWQEILVAKNYLPAGRNSSGGKANYVPHGLRCPANPNGYLRGEKSPPSSSPDKFKFGTPNYLYNNSSGSPVSFGGKPPSQVLRLSQLTGRKVMFFEGGEYKPWNHAYRCAFTIDHDSITYFDPDSANYKIADDVHNGSSHVIFWDGHVETILKEDYREKMEEIFGYAKWREGVDG